MNNSEYHTAICRALRTRHAEDIFAMEVTVAEGSRRLDAVAIPCSWSQPRLIGYEIKVSRADFLRDHKWEKYLESCKELIWVTCPGVVKDLSEIPEACGWQEISKNGARLMTKKKAPTHQIKVEKEARLYKLLLMRNMGAEDPAVFWERWLAEKRENRKLGRIGRFEIAATVADRLRLAERRQKDLDERLKRMENVERTLRELGVDPDKSSTSWQLERQVKTAIANQHHGELLESVSWLRERASALRDESLKTITRIDRIERAINQAAGIQKTE